MKTTLPFLLVLLSLNCFGQQSIIAPPKVDKRVELISIAFRLAGSQEYSETRFKTYVDDIRTHFDKYKDHELIQFVKTINDRVGYDAPMRMAIHLSQPPKLEPLVPFDVNIPSETWGKENAYKFAELLQRFYKDADCETFFDQQKSRYNLVVDEFMPVYREFDIDWYTRFYGVNPKGSFHILVGPGNGGGNYGPKLVSPDGNETIYAILGVGRVDSLGTPKFNPKLYLPVLVHEFNHSYANELTEKYKKRLEKSAKIIFKVVEGPMSSGQAYGRWTTMLDEALVRASVIKYDKDHKTSSKTIDGQLVQQLSLGFIWMKELVEELDKYDQNRAKYPTLESYMPQLIKFYKRIAKNIDKIKTECDKFRPKVTSIEQFKNGDVNVSPGIKEIKINFNMPMLGGPYYAIGYGDKGEGSYPKVNEVNYTDEDKAVVLKVELLPNKEYQLVLMGMGFMSKQGFPMNDYEINFKTAEK